VESAVKFFSKQGKPVDQIDTTKPFQFRDDDVFLVSYPKSGNTWVRFLVGNYLTNCTMDFSNGHLIMPDIHHDPSLVNKIPFNPRFIKSHFPFRSEYKKVIYLVRDGRETCVSYFYFLKKMKSLPLDTEFSDYFQNYFYAGKDPYGDWHTHVFSWTCDNKTDNVLLVRYEDLLSDTTFWFRKILQFSGIEVDEELLKKVVEKCSFHEMQKDEIKHKEALKAIGHDSSHTGYGIIRSGKTDTWKQIMSETEKQMFISKYGKALSYLGYEIE
jgi:hypothetical protein